MSWLKGAHQPRRPRSLRKNLEALGGPLPKADNEDWLDAVHIDGIGYDDLRRTIPALLETSTAEQLSLIIRPHGPDAMFIQLDDLTADQLPHLAPTMFLTFETSPGNFQAWLALPCKHDKELERMGLLAPPEQYPALPHARPRAAGNRNWPSYAMCLDGAPLNRAASGPDRSSADFWWCFLRSNGVSASTTRPNN